MYTSTVKNTFTLVKMQSFSISGIMSVRKCRLKIEKFIDICMTGGMHYTPSHILVKSWIPRIPFQTLFT